MGPNTGLDSTGKLSGVLVRIEDVLLLVVLEGGVARISELVLSVGVVSGSDVGVVDENVVLSAVVELEISRVVEVEKVVDSDEVVGPVDNSRVLDSFVLELVSDELGFVVEASTVVLDDVTI